MHADVRILAAPKRRRSGADARTVVDGLVRLGDVAIVATSGLLATQLRFAGAALPDVTTAALLMGVLLAACIFPLVELYAFERFTRLSYQLPRLLGGWAITLGAVLAVLYGLKSSDELSRLWVGYWFVTGSIGFIASRLYVKHAIHNAQSHGRLRRNLVLVGHGDLAADCLARLGSADQSLSIAGALILDDRPVAFPSSCHRMRSVAELDATIREVEADQVVLAIPLGATAEIQGLLRRLKHLPVEVALYPDLLGAGLPVTGLTRIADTPLVQLMRQPIDGWSYLAKSLEDRVLAAFFLLLALPAFAAIAAGIKLTSPGPVFYRQLRHGFNREPILVFKFRSMHAAVCDAPGATEVRQATRDDPRVTPLGHLLRQTSLDELPQLLNVLKGNMSLVGPRPHATAHDNHYSQLIDDYLGRHRVKPGITGWAQVNGCRGETSSVVDMRRRIELDLDYIEQWSLLLDLRILLRTLIVAVGGRGAY